MTKYSNVWMDRWTQGRSGGRTDGQSIPEHLDAHLGALANRCRDVRLCRQMELDGGIDTMK